MSTSKAFGIALIFWLLTTTAAFSESNNGWLDTDILNIEDIIDTDHMFNMRDSISQTGGIFWYRMSYQSSGNSVHVIDLSSTSAIKRYDHYAVNGNNEIVWHSHGGIGDTDPATYFFRHGQNLNLAAGNYTIYTRIDSPFLLAQPTPALFDIGTYQKQVIWTNTFTLVTLGIFVSLGFYYFTLGILTRQSAPLSYALFITGNLVFFSTALNVNNLVFGLTWFLPIGQTIIFSNMANLAFVMLLLNIQKHTSPRIFHIGISLMGLLILLAIVALANPSLSLECSRIGVAIFSIYGFASAIAKVRSGSRVARVYLVASVFFIVPAMAAIRLQNIPGSTVLIEHIGLLAVSIEVLMLALVISYQTGLVYAEKKAGLLATEQALQSANQALKSKERFLANVSHELRTPLNAIQGASDLLESENLTKPGRDYLHVIEHSSSLLLYLINDILDLTKINTHKLKINSIDFNIRDHLLKVQSLYAKLASDNSLKFSLTITERVPSFIHADDKRLEQVLVNLLSNAFKFTEKGCIGINVDLLENNLLYVEITDTGIGIPKDQFENIFTDFAQADTSISRTYGGTGLGLPISSKIISLMGGQLNADDTRESGSRFYFTVPIKLCAQETIKAAVQPSEDLSALSIVVVDDNEVNLKIMAGLLKKMNVNYSTFINASGAIRYLENSKCDLVLMDIQMPEISGLEACHILRNSGFKKPIVALTANASDEDRRAALDSGMDDFLTKPIKFRQLEELFSAQIHQ